LPYSIYDGVAKDELLSSSTVGLRFPHYRTAQDHYRADNHYIHANHSPVLIHG